MDVVRLLEELISFKSITPDEGGSMDLIKGILSDFEAIETEKEGVKNLFLYKRFGQGVHLCFAGHLDVVPPGEGWSSDPFVPLNKEGYIYGRGAQDMKSGVAAMVCALRDSDFSGTLSLLLTSDEEGDAIYGTRLMLEVLEGKGLLPDVALIGEPTADSASGDTVKIGRRGSINGELEIFGVQGHAAYYDKCVNPIELLGEKLGRIAGYRLDEGDEFFEPSRIVVTNMSAGMGATNVTPSSLKIKFNVRNSKKSGVKEIEEHIKNVLGDIKYSLRLNESSKPFMTDSDSILVQKASAAIKEAVGFDTMLSSSGGTSDARFFGLKGIPCVEIGVQNDRIHAVDERVSVDDLYNLLRIYRGIIDGFGSDCL